MRHPAGHHREETFVTRERRLANFRGGGVERRFWEKGPEGSGPLGGNPVTLSGMRSYHGAPGLQQRVEVRLPIMNARAGVLACVDKVKLVFGDGLRRADESVRP